MSDLGLPEAAGDKVLEPPDLDSKQKELGEKLDDLHAQSKLKAKPSHILKGAAFALQPITRRNPDWIAQAANSLRETLYPFNHRGKSLEDTLKEYGSVRIDPNLMKEVNVVYGVLNDLAHHGSDPRVLGQDPKWPQAFDTFTMSDFETLLNDFQRVMFAALERQADIYDDADEFLADPPSSQ